MKKVFTLFIIFLVLGCGTYKGGSVHDGINMNVGLKTPLSSSSATSLQLFWYLNGFVFQWEQDCNVEIRRTVISNSSLLGVWESVTTNSTLVILKKQENISK